jgi:hypothetical protein
MGMIVIRPEKSMNKFVENPTDFAAECARQDGQCTVARENFIFLDDGDEPAAVRSLHMKCGHVVIIPDESRHGQAVLYHTSCQRMTDVVSQIFADVLGAAASLPGASSEMTVGQLYRRAVSSSPGECRSRVDGFAFPSGPKSVL